MLRAERFIIYSEGKVIFSHGCFTATIFFIIFSLSIAITSLPIYIIRHTKIGIDSALYTMCVVELLLAIVAYFAFLHRLSEFQFSRFSTRQLAPSLITIAILQISYMLLSIIDLGNPTPVVLNLFTVITMVFIIPIYEEIFYRGCLFGFVCSIYKKGVVIPAVLSSVSFSFMHMQYTSLFEYGLMFTVGLILTYARVITKGLFLPLILHSTMNAFVLTSNFLLSK